MSTEGFKETQGKLRWSLLPMDALEEVVRVLEYGACNKYAMDNWKQVPHFGAYMDAIQRHWIAYFIKGEEFDKDSGLSHLAHMMCDVLFVEWHRKQRDEIPFAEYLQKLRTYPDYCVQIDMNKFGVFTMEQFKEASKVLTEATAHCMQPTKIPEVGELINVWDFDDTNKVTRIFAYMRPKGSSFPVVCVDHQDEKAFQEGYIYDICDWEHFERLPEKERIAVTRKERT